MTPAPTQFYPKDRKHPLLFGICDARVAEHPRRPRRFWRDAGDFKTPDIMDHMILIACPAGAQRALS